jgi:hypothetical protein
MRRGFITGRLRSSKKSIEIPIEKKIEIIEGKNYMD